MGEQIVPKTETEQHPRVALAKMLEASEQAIAKSLPKHLTPERMMRVAQTAISKTPALWDCAPDTIISSVVTASQLGLEPNGPLGHASLIPFKNWKTKRLECQLMVEYRGYIELASRTGKVSHFDAEIVYEGDEFEFELGLEPKLRHIPTLNRAITAKPIAGYAVVRFKEGASKFVVLSADDIEKIRGCSKAKDGDAWKQWWDEMAKKTCIRRLVKYVSLSADITHAANLAESMDGGVRPGENVAAPQAGADNAAAGLRDRLRQAAEPDDIDTTAEELGDDEAPPPSDPPACDADGVVEEEAPAEPTAHPADSSVFGPESKFHEKVTELLAEFVDLAVNGQGLSLEEATEKWKKKVVTLLGNAGATSMGELDQKGKNEIVKALAGSVKDYRAALDDRQ